MKLTPCSVSIVEALSIQVELLELLCEDDCVYYRCFRQSPPCNRTNVVSVKGEADAAPTGGIKLHATDNISRNGFCEV